MKRGVISQIARKAGVSQPFVSQVLSGRKRPSWVTAKRLADVTGTWPALWLEGTPKQIQTAVGQGKTREPFAAPLDREKGDAEPADRPSARR